MTCDYMTPQKPSCPHGPIVLKLQAGLDFDTSQSFFVLISNISSYLRIYIRVDCSHEIIICCNVKLNLSCTELILYRAKNG